jgi:hypothetical protein
MTFGTPEHKPRDGIDALVCGYASPVRERRVFVMLKMFADDSDSQDGDKLLFLAGYALAAPAWADFSDEWAAALSKPPVLQALHMRNCFQQWRPQAREEKLESLAVVLRKYRPFTLECSVSRAEFSSILLPHLPYDFRHAYWLLFHYFILILARHMRSKGMTGPAEFVFDNQGNVGLNALLWFQSLRKLQPPELQPFLTSDPSFKNDGDVLPLQAADMLAWHLRRRSAPECTERERELGTSIVFEYAQLHFDREKLTELASGISEIEGIENVKTRQSSLKKAKLQELARKLNGHVS